MEMLFDGIDLRRVSKIVKLLKKQRRKGGTGKRLSGTKNVRQTIVVNVSLGKPVGEEFHDAKKRIEVYGHTWNKAYLSLDAGKTNYIPFGEQSHERDIVLDYLKENHSERKDAQVKATIFKHL
jgi:hypothetical protein